MRKSIITLTLLGAVLGLASVSAEAAPQRGPAKFYDQHGGFRGYAWCLKAGLEIFDCSYFNKPQCDMSASAPAPLLRAEPVRRGAGLQSLRARHRPRGRSCGSRSTERPPRRSAYATACLNGSSACAAAAESPWVIVRNEPMLAGRPRKKP